MRYSDESKQDFIDRIKREKGVGSVSIAKPVARGNAAMALEVEQASDPELLIDMLTRCHARFDKEAQFGSAEKWGYDVAAEVRSRAAKICSVSA